MEIDRGGSRGRAPPKIGKNMIFGVKSWFFTRNTPKISHLPPQLEKIWFFGVKSWFFTRNTPKISHLPSQLEKIWFFGVKSWFFTRNIPKMFAPPSARRIFFKCATPNLKSWIRPWLTISVNQALSIFCVFSAIVCLFVILRFTASDCALSFLQIVLASLKTTHNKG
jgi:hypothetical protein